MDPNQLYSDHQLWLLRAENSVPPERQGFEAEATQAALHIRELKRSLGANAAAGWDRLAKDQIAAECSGADADSSAATATSKQHLERGAG